MKRLVVIASYCIFGIFAIIGVLSVIPANEYKIYDCSLAEFHPDYPAEVKEECRKLRSSKIITA